MSTLLFAQQAGQDPARPAKAKHIITCHWASLYWAFRTLGYSQAHAGSMMEAIVAAKCVGCQANAKTGGFTQHGSLDHDWYGTNLCRGALRVNDQAALQAYVETGDVLLVGN